MFVFLSPTVALTAQSNPQDMQSLFCTLRDLIVLTTAKEPESVLSLTKYSLYILMPAGPLNNHGVLSFIGQFEAFMIFVNSGTPAHYLSQ